jgi:hypothetical protein
VMRTDVFISGAERIRTAGLYSASVALYQLSYRPQVAIVGRPVGRGIGYRDAVSRAWRSLSWMMAVETSPRVLSMMERTTSAVRRRPPVMASG